MDPINAIGGALGLGNNEEAVMDQIIQQGIETGGVVVGSQIIKMMLEQMSENMKESEQY